MTDKQIIIDDCDVSGCEWFYKNDPCKNTCKYFCTPCEWVAIQNCMYKYAKLKEQECEELKSLLKVRIEDLCDSCGASSMMPMPCKVYEKTLTEIKEFVENEMTPNCDTNIILQKISEVENG